MVPDAAAAAHILAQAAPSQGLCPSPPVAWSPSLGAQRIPSGTVQAVKLAALFVPAGYELEGTQS